jgi:hypothetical protein
VEDQVGQVVQHLCARFPHVPRATIERRVRAAFDGYAEAPVQTFVQILVHREIGSLLASTVKLPGHTNGSA